MKKESSLQVVSVECPGEEFLALSTNKNGKREREECSEDSDVQVSTRALVVIKMKKWDLVLGSKKDILDFRQGTFKCVLVHEHDSTEVVERKGGTVLSCKFNPSKNGNTCAVEVIIGVLSSQLGGLFKICFTFDDRDSCYTDVIKVVSKKSQLEKDDKPKRVRTTQVATREAVLELIDEVRKERKKNEGMMERILLQNKQIKEKLDGKGCVKIEEGDETPQFSSLQDSCVDSLRKSLQAMAKLDASEMQTAMKLLAESMTQIEMNVLEQVSNNLIPSLPPKDFEFEFEPSNSRYKVELPTLDW